MERRELLKLITVVTGGALIGGELFLTGCKNDPKIGGEAFTDEDIAFLDEASETIMPATTTPGAKAAKTGLFMTVMVNDCYTKEDQKIFHSGISKLNDAMEKKHKVSFMEASPEQRKELFNELDKEAREYATKKSEFDRGESAKANEAKANGQKYEKKTMDPHYFTMVKQLSILGFFTSKTGATETLRHVAVPGKFDGNFPYKKGDKAWFEQ
ncbi:MAG: gluconate 2-dehydrogenase subunit 3 family protein [Chitinophagaceae bacterium]|nr:MAG: gluconate 2-dehydrogenase subunit 3 family protein [Chitinophagaceae bacterium]